MEGDEPMKQSVKAKKGKASVGKVTPKENKKRTRDGKPKIQPKDAKDKKGAGGIIA